eukprot:scaffold10.g2236.t1
MKWNCSALLVAVLLGLAWAARAQDVEDAGTLATKLSEVEAKLASVERESSSCSADREGLWGKLTAAEQAIKALEAKLAAPSPEDPAVKQLRAAAKAAKASLAAAETRLGEAEGKAAEAQDKAARLEAALAEARAAADGCSAARGAVEGAAEEARRRLKEAQTAARAAADELTGLKEEAAQARAEAAVHRAQYEELSAHHAGAWLPHWADERAKAALAAAGPAVGAASAHAQELWAAHAGPSLQRGASLAAEKGAELGAAANRLLERSVGDYLPRARAMVATHWPHARAAVAAGAAAVRKRVRAAWESEAVARVRPALATAAASARRQSQVVVGELEVLLIGLLSKQQSTIALARKPYATYMVYALLGAPLLVVGLPLLGLLLGGRRRAPSVAAESQGTPFPSAKKKKKVGDSRPAGQRPSSTQARRISEGADSVRVP